MRCLSLHEPWASLWASGEKKIETRSWAWPHDLPAVLAVHAARYFPPPRRLMCEQTPFHAALNRIGWYERPIPLGCVVGLVRLVECVGAGTARAAHGLGLPCLAAKYLATFPDEAAFGDYGPGRYCWVADRFLTLAAPIPLRGFQGVFNFGDDAELERSGRSVLAGDLGRVH